MCQIIEFPKLTQDKTFIICDSDQESAANHMIRLGKAHWLPMGGMKSTVLKVSGHAVNEFLNTIKYIKSNPGF